MNGWWAQWRERRALSRRAIPDDLWRLTLARFPFLVRSNEDDQAELRRLATLFLDRKEFSGAHGLVVDDAMAVAIAAQACLPILKLGLDRYDGFIGIVVHADAVVAERTYTDDDGIVHEYEEELSGEAMQGGPVMLSWHDVAQSAGSARLGLQRRHPRVRARARHGRWRSRRHPAAARPRRHRTLGRHHRCRVRDLLRTCRWREETLLDPYGAEGVDEFFAVASEVFFVAPFDLKSEHPPLYDLFVGFYQQDPARQL